MNKWMLALLAFAFGMAAGLGVAVYIAMRVNMMDLIVPGFPVGWLVA